VYRQKIYRAEIKGVDEEAATVTAVVSTEAPDRDGDIIRVNGWDFTNFNKHPVLLADHNYWDIKAQIGEWTEMKAIKGRNPRVEGTAKYYIGEGNEKADWAFSLAKKGMAAFSVGFIPDMAKAELIESEDGHEDFWFWGPFEFNGQELLETSQVTIPAHPDALQRMKRVKGLDVPSMIERVVEGLQKDYSAEPTAGTGISTIDVSQFTVGDEPRKLIKALEQRMDKRFDNIQAALQELKVAPEGMAREILDAPLDITQLINEGVDEALTWR